MAVMVDELREYPHVRWENKHWCHLASDSDYKELHDFAAQLGVSRDRFQGDHYDLPPRLRALAIDLGAEQVRTSEMTARMSGPRGDRARARRARRAG